MSNRVLHKQLASIMEVLANTAVAEICKVVDDGYAVLRLEISQSKKENEALRRKLNLLELRVARGGPDKARVRENSSNIRSDGSHLCSELKGTTTGESYFSLTQQMDTSLGRNGENSPQNEDDSPLHSVAMEDQCADMEEGRTEPLLIKEERLEEDSDPLGELKFEEERTLGLRPGGGERPPIQEVQNKAANHTEELSEQQRTRHGVWEVSGPEPVLKAEAETESARQGLQHRGCELRAGGLDSLDSAEFVMFDRPGQLGTYCMQGSANTETEDPCCSYSAETDPESLSFHSEMQSTTVAGTLGGNSVALGPADVNLETVMTGSASFHVEDEIHTVWNKDTNSVSQYGLYNLERNSETQPVNDTSSCAPYTSVQTREKLFICTYCGKGFNRPKKLEIHQRIHTGEKPFSCALCGKRFAQSCNLNRHKIVHTGEKPFGCTQCDKRFSQSCHLKTHQRVHTKGRPYSWNRFSDKRSLRFQQHRKHTGL